MVNNNKEFNMQIRIYYEDTDAGGVVYHSQYLNFMERARTEWLRSMGFEQHILIGEYKILFAVCSINIDYNRPAFFDQLLDIKTHLIKQRKVSMFFEQIISNQSKQTICNAEIKIACLNSDTMQPAVIPETILLELN